MFRPILIVTMFALSCAQAGLAHAARVVQFEILVDGQIVLTVYTGDQGEDDADKVWARLKTEPARNPADVFVVTEAEADRLRTFHADLNRSANNKATLTGKCRIFCRYGGDVTVAELKLVRANAKAPWFIDPNQVDELAKTRTVDAAKRSRSQVDGELKK